MPFPEGAAFNSWLGNVGAVTGGELPIHYARDNAQVSAANSKTTLWISASKNSSYPGYAQYFSFDVARPERLGSGAAHGAVRASPSISYRPVSHIDALTGRACRSTMASMSSDLRVPHFLRVTQALALVSGLGLSGCSGSVTTTSGGSDASNGQGGDGQNVVSGDDSGVQAYEGGPLGVVVGGGVQPYDGGPSGVTIHDGGPMGVGVIDSGVLAYDGGPVGVRVYDGGPLGITVPPDGGVLVGGPLIAPELPA